VRKFEEKKSLKHRVLDGRIILKRTLEEYDWRLRVGYIRFWNWENFRPIGLWDSIKCGKSLE
jgi:hypothetical protein